MNTTKAIISVVMLVWSAGAWARAGVGNGGDSLRLIFEMARQHAAAITLKMNDRSLPMNLNPELRSWILTHNRELAADITGTAHEWSTDNEPTCAWTKPTPAAVLELSFPACNPRIQSFDDAGKLLIHESVHHLGVTEEPFADAVALAVYAAWRSGATEWVTIAASPEARSLHTAVWTGKEMIIQGGLLDGGNEMTSSAYAYDPKLDLWKKLSSENAPARFTQQVVFTGDLMIVWGGYEKRGQVRAWQNSGAIYNPARNEWEVLENPYGPAELNDIAVEERAIQTMVWTGKEIIVYGGTPIAGKIPGGIYNPTTKVWKPLSSAGAPVRIAGHSAIWADDRMIVWGGMDGSRNLTNTGFSFDPTRSKWTQIQTAEGPAKRDGHSAVFTGTSMIVIGGHENHVDLIGTGGIYDIRSNRWTPIRTESLIARTGQTAVWNSHELLIFGGKSHKLRSFFSGVNALSPVSTWRLVETDTAPEARRNHSAVWTGSSMIIFGGTNAAGYALGSGGIFYP